MAHDFSGSTVIDRPINEVFAFLSDGTNDPRFSPRVQEIRQTTPGPIGVGTVFESKVKDAGMTTNRTFELTTVDAPNTIRWTERSKNMITVPDGGYDLEAVSATQTKVTIHNEFEGRGFGKVIVGFALRAAIKDAPAFAERIKSAVEAADSAAGRSGRETLIVMGRHDTTFVSDGTECAAWLYEPDGAGPHPIVVMAHGFSATRDQRLDVYAEHFRTAGIGVLLFDYRHFGASGGEPRQLLDVGRQHADFRAALGHVRGIDWVDRSRVGLFGSSFSGGHVIAVAAADGQVAAVVSQCPFTDGLASLAPIGMKNLALATVAGLRDQVRAYAGRSPHYVPAVGPPGSFAVMTAPDAEPGFANITGADSGWVNRVAGRVALRVGLYRPGRAAARVACPILFCVCDEDSVAPAKRTLKWAATAPRGEVKRYPVGHFEIYVGEPFEQAIADQTDFLARTLTPDRSAQHSVS